MKKKVLVLGSNGMVGRTVFKYLLQSESIEVHGSVKSNPKKNQFIFLYKTDTDIESLLQNLWPVDFVINCIGTLKDKDAKDYSLNYNLPNELEKLSEKLNFDLIHISTDDVFDPKLKKVNELSPTNPKSLYGISKLKGETKSKKSLTIRTSFIGFDDNGKGLIEWLIKNRNKNVEGYKNQLWKGCTTLQFAQLCEYLILNDNFKKLRRVNSVFHFAPLGPITKYKLLKNISKNLKLNTKINPTNSPEKVTRQLNSKIKLVKKFNSFDKALKEAATFNKSPEKILITGGAGYIGSALVEILLEKNYKVVVLDNFMYKNKKLFDKIKNKNLKIIPGDITNSKDVRKALRNVKKVVHLAGLVGDPACSLSPELTTKINVEGTRLLINESVKQGVTNFIFASSCSIYGVTKKKATEKTKPNPVSLYSETKIISENDLFSIKSPGFKPTILRFSTIFGASRRPRFDLAANKFSAEAFFKNEIKVHDGAQWRPFIHVRDVARAIELVLASPNKRINREIFNVGDDDLVITISDLAKIIKKSFKNKKIKIIKESSRKDPRNYRVSFKKINKTLRFKKSISLEEGIEEIIENFEKKKFDYKKPIYSNVDTLSLILKNSPKKK